MRDDDTIDGEIVDPEPGDDGQQEQPPSTAVMLFDDGMREDDRRRFNGGPSRYTEDDIEQAIHLRAIGFNPTEIARKMNENGVPVSRDTVVRWFRTRLDERHPARVNLAETQARMVVELEGMQHEAMRVARMWPGTDLAIRGLAQARNILATRAQLLGVEPTKKVDPLEADEAAGQDAELVALVQQARDEAWADAQRVRNEYAERNGTPPPPGTGR